MFKKELEQELKYMKGMTWAGHFKWPVEHLLETINEIAYFSNSEKGGRNRKWTVATDLLVKIYRSELNNSRAAESFYQNLATQDASAVIDNDEGDYD